MSKRELRIVLIGPTGAGKSATGNSLLRDNKFEENDDPQKGTHFSQTEEADCIQEFRDYKLSITDTPGPCSTDQDQEQSFAQILQFIGQLSPGPHVIIIVISTAQRVSIEIQETVEVFTEMFGKESTAHMMFLFTKIDQLTTRFDPKPTPIKEWVEVLCNKDDKFKAILLKCGERFCGINNRIPFDSDEYKQQVSSIMNMILQISNNGHKYYTNKDFKQIEEKIMIPLDKQTGNRIKSRKVLITFLLGVIRSFSVLADTAGEYIAATAGALRTAAITGTAGISPGGWRIYKTFRSLIVKDVNKAVTEQPID